MMLPISVVSVFLGSLAACDASIPDEALIESSKFPVEIKRRVILKPKRSRKLEGEIFSSFTAFWYFEHEGNCLESKEPMVSLHCTNGGNATVKGVSELAFCDEVSVSELLCSTLASKSTNHTVDFTCSGAKLDDIIASATILGQTSDCLGGSAALTNWGHGIQLSMTCGDEAFAHNGTCDPLDSTFSDGTCSTGFECKSNCAEANHTIVDITSFITNADCNKDSAVASGSSNVGTILSTSFAAAVTILFW